MFLRLEGSPSLGTDTKPRKRGINRFEVSGTVWSRSNKLKKSIKIWGVLRSNATGELSQGATGNAREVEMAGCKERVLMVPTEPTASFKGGLSGILRGRTSNIWTSDK